MIGVPAHRPDSLEEQRRLAEAVRQLLVWQQGPGRVLDMPDGQLRIALERARRGDFGDDDYPVPLIVDQRVP